jgi:hypothetical protein
MRAIWIVIFATLFASTGHAGMYLESEVLDAAGMEKRGVEVKAIAPAGKQAGLFVRLSILPDGGGRKYRDMTYVVLDRKIDGSFKKDGSEREIEKWAKVTKKQFTEKTLWTINVIASEMPYSYILVRYWLPSKDDISGLGYFYILISEIQAN